MCIRDRLPGQHIPGIRLKVRTKVKKIEELPLILRPRIKIDRSFQEFSSQKSVKSSAILPKTPTALKYGKENETSKFIKTPTISRNQFVKNIFQIHRFTKQKQRDGYFQDIIQINLGIQKNLKDWKLKIKLNCFSNYGTEIILEQLVDMKCLKGLYFLAQVEVQILQKK
eukprot:TRINITY_DN5210_c0_g1_i2.p1 TRINITY_DN5210_c0_g1~~TRINITY_DN5210_c0_g1_i2.p1  ORF type:complete len:184 (-),score=24.10 TRINITY_DN5210_c0_g1_i2:172-678(-)